MLIEDDGVGAAPADRPIWSVASIVPGALAGGNGLGLSIAQASITARGGEIDFQGPVIGQRHFDGRLLRPIGSTLGEGVGGL